MSPTMSEPTARATQTRLGAPEVRRFLRDYVKRRVGESDVDDVVQTVLVEALASSTVPEGDTDLRKWLVGVARHKIADLHRRGGREQPAELPDVETGPAPLEERELVRWVEDQTKGSRDAEKTLSWMAREGEGDKLEHIADEEKLPAATVRQRVSRMRRWMKERWLAELAAVAALGILAFVVWRFLLSHDPDQIAVPEPTPTAPPTPTARPDVKPDSTTPPVAPDAIERVARGKALRKEALENACAKGDGPACLEQLDEAKALDPDGDAAPEVGAARLKSESVQQPAPTALPIKAPPPVKPPAPTSTGKPPSFMQKTAPKPSFDKKSSSFESTPSSSDFGTGTGLGDTGTGSAPTAVKGSKK